ncbi:MAG: hypothetical protein M3R49_01690 [Chloroflexota bacterium]|nr:hypothetical protein [Chloroflexota bacterium]
MTEAITESFCERCGTRYEFNAPTRLNAMRKTRGLVTGLRNYIMSQDALGDAIGDGIRTEEEALASHQLDAFHQSFSFCIDCRQYTCINCWNDDAGRCRSCVPITGADDFLRQLDAATAYDAVQAAELKGATLELETAWPSSDLVMAEANGNGHPGVALPADGLEPIAEAVEEPLLLEAIAEPVEEPLVLEPIAEAVSAELEPELVIAELEPELVIAELELELEPEPVIAELELELEPEPVIAALEPAPEAQPFEYTLEPEPIQAALEPEPVPGIVEPPVHILAWDDDAAAEAEPEPVAAEAPAEPEPVAAEAAPEPEPVAAEAEAAPETEPIPFERRSYTPISETIMPMPRPTPAPARDRVAAEADTATLAARRAQLDSLGLDDPGQGSVESARPNMLPYRSRGASPGSTDLSRRMVAHGGVSFWDASAREVAEAMSHVGVQSCGQCGLSLSASAHFCRRCGTQQARSA